jgi:hypothetical protein
MAPTLVTTRPSSRLAAIKNPPDWANAKSGGDHPQSLAGRSGAISNVDNYQAQDHQDASVSVSGAEAPNLVSL